MGPSPATTRPSHAMGADFATKLASSRQYPYIVVALYGYISTLYGRSQPMATSFNTPSSLSAGLRCRCPRCGEGHVFSRFLTVADSCEACGLEFSFADPAD